MKPSEYYAAILGEITNDTERLVFDILSRRIGEWFSRETLILEAFGNVVAKEMLGSNADDRRIRKCIESLRHRGYPIVSSSGEAGYRLVDDPDLIDGCIAEERSRIVSIESKIKMLYRAKDRAKVLHTWREESQVPVQAEMFRG